MSRSSLACLPKPEGWCQQRVTINLRRRVPDRSGEHAREVDVVVRDEGEHLDNVFHGERLGYLGDLPIRVFTVDLVVAVDKSTAVEVVRAHHKAAHHTKLRQVRVDGMHCTNQSQLLRKTPPAGYALSGVKL